MKRKGLTATGRVLSSVRRYGVWGRVESDRRPRPDAFAKDGTPRLLPAPDERVPCCCGGTITYSSGECDSCNRPEVFGA